MYPLTAACLCLISYQATSVCILLSNVSIKEIGIDVQY